MTATILHADLDAFYASVEQLLDPSLRGRPIAVGGGVVLAASYEARRFGIRGGMPGRLARELCPGLVFVGGHFDEYRRLGDAAIGILSGFTPLVERISIDEAFADVAGCAALFGSPAEIAAAVRRRVRDELGLANRDPRRVVPKRRVRSAGAQSALGRQAATQDVIRPTLLRLADRIATRLRAKGRPGRTVTVRVRFADLRSVSRSVTLDAPISSTATLCEIAAELVFKALADHPAERSISLLAIAVSHLEDRCDVQLELPLGLADGRRRPSSRQGLARGMADAAVDAIRRRFGWDSVGFAAAALAPARSVPDAFRELAEKEL